MKKLSVILLSLIFISSCAENDILSRKNITTPIKKQEEVKREIIQRLPQIIKEVEEDYPIKYEEDNFNFIFLFHYIIVSSTF